LGVYVEVVPLKVRDVIRLLEENQWRLTRMGGDHRVSRNPDGRTTVVSGKLGDDVRPGTWKSILRQTGMKE
jgi:predicted RNA binding protein YcfA (HicA-like mRNA interferase family)